MNFVVNTPIKHNGREYLPENIIENLNDDDKDALLKLRAIAPIVQGKNEDEGSVGANTQMQGQGGGAPSSDLEPDYEFFSDAKQVEYIGAINSKEELEVLVGKSKPTALKAINKKLEELA